MSSDRWFREMERLTAEKEDAGLSPEQAYKEACEQTSTSLAERLRGAADIARLCKKEGR